MSYPPPLHQCPSLPSVSFHRLEVGGRVGDRAEEGVVEDGNTGDDVATKVIISFCESCLNEKGRHSLVADQGGVLLGGEDGVRDTLGLGQVLDLSVDDGEGVHIET